MEQRATLKISRLKVKGPGQDGKPQANRKRERIDQQNTEEAQTKKKKKKKKKENCFPTTIKKNTGRAKSSC